MTGAFALTFVCVAANHLGLVEAVECVLKRRIPVVNCPKCLTFWANLAYWLPSHNFLFTVAAAFVAAYAATWLELAMGVIDYIYMWIYGKITDLPDTEPTAATTPTGGRSREKRAVSGVRERQTPGKT